MLFQVFDELDGLVGLLMKLLVENTQKLGFGDHAVVIQVVLSTIKVSTSRVWRRMGATDGHNAVCHPAVAYIRGCTFSRCFADFSSPNLVGAITSA